MTGALPLIGTPEGRAALEALASELSLNPAAVFDLLRVSDQHSGKLRRKGLFQAFDAILDRAGC